MASDWRPGLLSEVVESIDYGLSIALSAEASGIPVLRMGNLKNGRVDLTDLKFVPIERVSQKDILADGDVLLNRTNSADLVGKVGIFRAAKARQTTFASYLFRLRARPSIAHPEWLLQVLASGSYQQKLRDIATRGVSQSNINRERLRDLPVQIPPLPEQRKIAAILSSVDKTIEKTEAVIERLDVVKKAMLEELLTRGMPGRHSRFKETEIGVVPEGWSVAGLLDVADIASGQVDPKEAPYREWQLIAPNHIESGTGRLLESSTAEEQGAISGKYAFERGDVLYSKIRPYLRKAALATAPGLCSADMYPLRCRPSIRPGFLLAVLLSERFTEYAASVSMRTGIPKINREELAGYKCAVPPTAEQDSISDLLLGLQAHIASESDVHRSATQLKECLSRALLSGEIRVSPGELEP